MILQSRVGKIILIKVVFLLNSMIFTIRMGRPKKNKEEKKVKISISLDRNLYLKIKKSELNPSRIIENLVREFCGNKNL